MSNLANTLRDLADEHSLELSDSARQALEEAASLLFRQSTEIAALTAALAATKDNAPAPDPTYPAGYPSPTGKAMPLSALGKIEGYATRICRLLNSPDYFGSTAPEGIKNSPLLEAYEFASLILKCVDEAQAAASKATVSAADSPEEQGSEVFCQLAMPVLFKAGKGMPAEFIARMLAGVVAAIYGALEAEFGKACANELAHLMAQSYSNASPLGPTERH